MQMETIVDERVGFRDPQGLMWRTLGASQKRPMIIKIIEIIIIAVS